MSRIVTQYDNHMDEHTSTVIEDTEVADGGRPKEMSKMKFRIIGNGWPKDHTVSLVYLMEKGNLEIIVE